MSQRHGFFSGIAFLACGTVVLQIALTRLYAALFGPHFAGIAISLSLLGAGLGGVLLYIFPRLATPASLLARLAYLAALAATATVVGLLVILETKPGEAFDAASLVRLAVIYVASSLPFVFLGVAGAAALRHAASDVSRLYFVGLTGAAAGCLAAIAALYAGAPRAFLIACLLDAAGAIAFYFTARAPAAPGAPREARLNGGVVAAVALASAVLLAGDLGAPWLKLPGLRWATLDKAELQAWNDMALVTVDKAIGSTAWLRTNGTASSPIFDAKTTPPAHPDEMAYALHKAEGPVLIIDPGGGGDVRDALKYGQKDVHVVEANPVIAQTVMRGRYKAWSGDLYDKPEVHVAVTDGRSYVRASPVKFRNIVLSMSDTAPAAAVGALALTESHDYTVEAFREYLEHLEPSGTLVVTRPDSEFERLLALAAAGLRASSAAQPPEHLFACSAARATSLLVKRTPLTRDEIDALRRHCKRSRFEEAFAPDAPHSDLRWRLTAAADVRAAAPDHPLDLSPPTDDRPFFFYTVSPSHLVKALRDINALKAGNQGLLLLLSLLCVSAVLALLLLLGPFALGRRPEGPAPGAPPSPARLRPLIFFACLGGGFVFAGTALVMRFTLFLGHPTYALSTVLVTLLLWTGIGSLLSARVDAPRAPRAASQRAQALVLVLTVYAVALDILFAHLGSLPFGARLALMFALLAPVGLLVGAQVPLGVRILSAQAPALIPWCWGGKAAAGVVATALGGLLALNFGFSALLFAGAVSYLLSALLVPRYPEETREGGKRAPVSAPLPADAA